MFQYRVKISRVVDGDTVDANIDLGFNIIHKARIRMLGIDTPESRTRNKKEKALGLASKARLKELIRAADKVTIRTSKDGKGKFGRVLATLEGTYSGIGGLKHSRNINQAMVSEGHARPYYGGSKNERGPWVVEEDGQWKRWTAKGYVELEEEER